MRMLLITAVLAMAAAGGGVPIATAATPDPVVGTWKLDVSKSTFTAGPAIKSQTRKYSQAGKTITLVMKTVGADGKKSTTHTTYHFNGKDYPVTGNADYDSLSGKQVDANTAEFTLKKGGKEVGTSSRTVSQDGKTLTSKIKMTTVAGEKTESVLVFDKQ
jgi:hypothetical protein